MSDKTGIEWTQATWNPTVGCRRVSEGCRNCYAEPTAQRIVAMQRALGKRSPYEDVVRMDAASGAPLPLWNGHVKALADRLDQPLRWSKPRLIFVNSMSDLFHEDVPDEFIDQVFAIMAATPRHTYQLLTKRPARMLRYLQRVAASQPHDEVNARVFDLANASFGGFAALPLPNLWVGVSVENQAAADERIPLLLECPAAVRWVSAEPLLGPVNLELLTVGDGEFMDSFRWRDDEDGLDWVVVGGESGRGARVFDVAWARSIVGQCAEAHVPVFVKQLGSRPVTQHPMGAPGELVSARTADRKGGDPDEWPDDLRVRQWPEACAA